MITQVSDLNAGCATKDPRRKAQRVKFRNSSNITYKSNYNQNTERQQKSALLTSLSIVLGSLIFATAYFMVSSLRDAKK